MDRQQKSWDQEAARSGTQPKKDLTKTNINADIVKVTEKKSIESKAGRGTRCNLMKWHIHDFFTKLDDFLPFLLHG